MQEIADTVLLRLTAHANQASTLDELYEPALEAICSVARIDRAAILLGDAAGVMRFVASRGLSPEYRTAVDGHSPWPRGLRDALPILVGDVRDDASLVSYGDLFEREGIRALAFVPLVAEHELLGKFMLYSELPRLFSPREIDLAQAIAAQVAQAVARTQAYARERAARLVAERQAERMRRLHRVTAALSRALSPRDVAATVLGEGVAAIGAATGAIWLRDGDELELLGAHNYPDGVKRRLALDSDSSIVDAVRRGVSIWIASAAEYAARYPGSLSRHQQRMPDSGLAIVSLPLMIGEHAIGGLGLAFTGARRFDDDERTFLELLAQHCAHGLERARLYEEAVRAVSVRDDFLSVAGHELKTPLTALLLQSQQMVRMPDATRAGERAERVLRHATRLTRLIDELLDVSRIVAGRLSLEREPVDLATVLDECLGRLADDAARAGCPLEIAIERPLRGVWDAMRLEQIVGNVVSNALKYGAGKPVAIAARAENGRAVLRVRDHGIGIAPEDHARIFGRFERAASSRQFGGLGLGLWIVRQIVEAHGGAIVVDSTPGQGAEFRVELPLGEAR